MLESASSKQVGIAAGIRQPPVPPPSVASAHFATGRTASQIQYKETVARILVSLVGPVNAPTDNVAGRSMPVLPVVTAAYVTCSEIALPLVSVLIALVLDPIVAVAAIATAGTLVLTIPVAPIANALRLRISFARTLVPAWLLGHPVPLATSPGLATRPGAAIFVVRLVKVPVVLVVALGLVPVERTANATANVNLQLKISAQYLLAVRYRPRATGLARPFEVFQKLFPVRHFVRFQE
jgi:hypothetical protein